MRTHHLPVQTVTAAEAHLPFSSNSTKRVFIMLLFVLAFLFVTLRRRCAHEAQRETHGTFALPPLAKSGSGRCGEPQFSRDDSEHIRKKYIKRQERGSLQRETRRREKERPSARHVPCSRRREAERAATKNVRRSLQYPLEESSTVLEICLAALSQRLRLQSLLDDSFVRAFSTTPPSELS